jgi:hypothetical protein
MVEALKEIGFVVFWGDKAPIGVTTSSVRP